MYKKQPKTAIAKTRYSFKKGWSQISIGEKKKVEGELRKALNINGGTYFSTILNRGIYDISVPRYEAINEVFNKRGITEIWTVQKE